MLDPDNRAHLMSGIPNHASFQLYEQRTGNLGKAAGYICCSMTQPKSNATFKDVADLIVAAASKFEGGLAVVKYASHH